MSWLTVTLSGGVEALCLLALVTVDVGVDGAGKFEMVSLISAAIVSSSSCGSGVEDWVAGVMGPGFSSTPPITNSTDSQPLLITFTGMSSCGDLDPVGCHSPLPVQGGWMVKIARCPI